MSKIFNESIKITYKERRNNRMIILIPEDVGKKKKKTKNQESVFSYTIF